MPPSEAGRDGGKTRRCRSRVHNSPHLEEIDAAIVAGLPLIEAASRFGFSKSALGRHRLKCISAPIVRAVARAVSPEPDAHEIELFEDKLVAEMLSVHAVAREELDAARKGPDKRLVVVLLGQLRENIVALGRFLPSSRESEEPPHVAFTFPEGKNPYRYLESARVPEPELVLPVATAEVTLEASGIPEVEAPEAISDEQPEPTRMLGPLDVTFGRLR